MVTRPKTVGEALQFAIQDYNDWQSGVEGYDPVKAYADLRGIFYNKLKAKLVEVDGWKYRVGNWRGSRSIYPKDIKLELDAGCFIVWIDINYYSSHSTLRNEVLKELHEACKVFRETPKSFEDNLSSIVKQIKDFSQ